MSKRTWRGLVCVLPIAMVGIVSMVAVAAEEHQVRMGDLIHDTQKIVAEGDDLIIAWWLPTAFWEVSARQGGVDKAKTEEMVSVTRPYVIVMIVKAKTGPFGSMTYVPEARLRDMARLVDRDGNEYAPLDPDKVNEDARNLLRMMRPFIESSAGPVGKSMYFVVFPARNAKGEAIADAKEEGRFAVRLGKDQARWRLPLGSLLPPKTCAKCQEQLSGAFKYCPYCGSKLPERK